MGKKSNDFFRNLTIMTITPVLVTSGKIGTKSQFNYLKRDKFVGILRIACRQEVLK